MYFPFMIAAMLIFDEANAFGGELATVEAVLFVSSSKAGISVSYPPWRIAAAQQRSVDEAIQPTRQTIVLPATSYQRERS